MKRAYEIFADYFQFYLWDKEINPDAPVEYTDEDISNRIKAAPHVVVIQPERNMTVPVSLEIVARAPQTDLAQWDHVAEASLDLPSGILEIHECTGDSIDVIDLSPGCWRVRLCCAGLGSLNENRLEGDDRYALFVWPAPFAPLAILKQY